MAKYRINVPDSMVGVDGEFRKVNLDDINPDVHAVVWNDKEGFVEYTGVGDVTIDSFADFQKFVDRWALQTPPPPVPLTGYAGAQAQVAVLYEAAVAEVEAARIAALVAAEGARPGGSPAAKAYVDAASQLAKEQGK